MGRRPAWVTNPPKDTDSTVYFVSAGSDASGDPAEAEAQASRALAGEITKYMGVSISSETTVEARATIDEYEAQITETIRERSDAMVSGFKIVDRYIETTDTGTVFVYLLGGYDRSELEAEKARLAALFQERIEAISGPEREAGVLLAEGKPVESAQRYLEAAGAALTSDVDNAMVRYERVMASAREAVSQIRLEKRTEYQTTSVGKPLPQPFVVYVSGADGSPLSGVPLLFTYRVARPGGRLSVRTATMTTGRDGQAAFELPIPESAGERELIASLDLAASLEPLRAARGKAQDLLTALENVINTKRVTFQYRIVSESAAIPTAIAVTDFDRDGVATGSIRTSEALTSALSSAGYTVTLVAAGPDASIASLREAYAAKFKRIITGKARITSVESSDGSFLAKVEASVTVTDLETGQSVYAANATKTVRSRTQGGIADAAFVAIGEEIGATLAAELP